MEWSSPRGCVTASIPPSTRPSPTPSPPPHPTAGNHLWSARQHAYALHPPPTAPIVTPYAPWRRWLCPLVLPNNPKPTLGTVIAHLHDAGRKWSFVLVDKDGNGDPVRWPPSWSGCGLGRCLATAVARTPASRLPRKLRPPCTSPPPSCSCSPPVHWAAEALHDRNTGRRDRHHSWTRRTVPSGTRLG